MSDFKPTEFALPDAPTHISAVEFTADGAFLASAAWSGNVIVWDVETGMVSDGPFALKIGSIRDMALAPD